MGQAVFGPVSGELDPKSSDSQMAQRSSSVSLTDFIAQVRFTVPRAATTVDENYSFQFRLTSDTGYAMTVYQDGAWALYTADKTVAQGTASPQALEPGSQHTMRLEVLDRMAVLYLDGIRVAVADVSEIQTAGAVVFAAGAGDKVQFQDFTVWRLR